MSIRIQSGRTGRVIQQWSHSPRPVPTIDIGDIDGDGFDDVVMRFQRPGYEYEFRSGQDGSLINTVFPLHPALKITIQPMGDVDGDGRADVLLSQLIPQTNWHRVAIHSAFDGSLIRLVALVNLTSVSPCGDVNADGITDVMIGEQLAPQARIRRVYSGADGSVLWASPQTGNDGNMPRGSGDVDGDGHDDILLYIGGNIFWMYSGATGAFLYTVSGPDARSPLWIGDVDGDGADDLAMEESQGVRVLSGASAVTIVVYEASLPTFHFGSEFVSFLGDSDGDGVGELIINETDGSYIVPLPALLGSCATGAPAITVNGALPPARSALNLALGDPLTLGVDLGLGANFIVFGHLGLVGPAESVSLPFGLSMCFSPSFLEPSNPNLFLLANSFDPNSPQALLPSTPTPWSWSLGSGIPVALDVAFQGFILTGPGTLQRTNAVQLRVR